MSANLTLENNYFKSYSIPQAKNYCVAVSQTNDNFISSSRVLSIPFQPVNNTTASLSDSWTVAPEGNPTRIVCGVSGWYRISSACNIIQLTSQTQYSVQIAYELYLNGNPVQPLNKEAFPVLTFSPKIAGDGWDAKKNINFNIILYLNEDDYIEPRIPLGAGNAVGAFNYQFKDLNLYCDYLGF
jgi:hypothetical protein